MLYFEVFTINNYKYKNVKQCLLLNFQMFLNKHEEKTNYFSSKYLQLFIVISTEALNCQQQGKLSLELGLEMASSNAALLITASFGYSLGFDLINILQLVKALGTLNSTILPNPSSCKDSAARQYSASAIDGADLLSCLNAQ